MNTVVPLEELAFEPPPPPKGDAVDQAMLVRDEEPIAVDVPQIQSLVDFAMQNRPELASLSEHRSTYAQAAAERASTRPQVKLLAANLYQNSLIPPHRSGHRRRRLRPELDHLRRRQAGPPGTRWPWSSAPCPRSAWGKTTPPQTSGSRSDRHG